MKKVLILGSTGSVGQQVLEVIEASPSLQLAGLTAHSNEELVATQAAKFSVPYTLDNLPDFIAETEADIVLNAISGAAGLPATLASLEVGKSVALANKESLVIDGARIMQLAAQKGVQIIPVDSEHAALHQALQNIDPHMIARLILTCSGGPFYGRSRQDLQGVTPHQALAHPTWEMGPKISIDSATLINKGFEIIEAHHLFNLPYDQIEVRIHPESKVHGIIQLKDGNSILVASETSMKIAIHYALHYPGRTPAPLPELDFNESWTFAAPSGGPLEGIQLGYQAGRANRGAEFVATNDAAVQDFLDEKISFLEIYDHVKQAL
jgi:1-deoxy-D-xylulose-5-phosphate reductoisomerase